MARFLGNATGRTTTTYVDTACSQLCTYTNTCIGCACSQLCTYVNTACSNLCTYVNTACSNLCTYVNNCKVACNGSGACLSNVVNSISVAGSGISVNQSTGAVTITGTGAADPRILYKCGGCWNGSAVIPVADRGRYTMYEIRGQTYCHVYFCSQAAFAFAGCGGCVANFESWCCTQCSCGVVSSGRTGNWSCYNCAGAIAWPFGCGGGNYSCITACTSLGYTFVALIGPSNVCDGSDRSFRYCFATSNNGAYGYRDCGGVRSHGIAINCCGAFPACLVGVCFTTPSSGNPFGGPTGVTIIGHGRLS